MTKKYDKGNDELIANLGKAEVAVINVDTAMYHAQMRATSMLGSLSKAGTGGTTDTTDPAADAAAKIQQRAVDSAKSELHLLAEKYAQPGDGVMFLSASDLARVPAYFRGTLADIGAKKGGSLTLSDESRDLNGGFVLAYGGIEENCTFEAMFEENKERLQDVVREKLFS